MTTPFIEKIISLYLFGTETPPSNLLNDNLIRDNNTTITLSDPLSALDYMTTGAGRFVKASQFEIVQQFVPRQHKLDSLM